MSALLGCVAALALLLFRLDFLDAPRVALFVASVGNVLAIPIVFACICRFDADVMGPSDAEDDT